MARRGGKSLLLVLVALAATVFLAAPVASSKAPASNQYTADMQKDVRAIVKRAEAYAAGLVRLLFHDCWVNGCDGSVLLDYTPFSSSGKTEKASGRNRGLRALDVIDTIKKDLGPKYGMTCTDAIIYAAREATFILSKEKIAYNVSGPGRRDGVVSKPEDADRFLPDSTFNFDALLANFDDKKFTREELVVLSGAHSIGQAHKESFEDRLATTTKDNGEIDGRYQCAIEKKAEKDKVVKNNVRDMDFSDFSISDMLTCKPIYDFTGVDMSAKGKDVLDNSYYTANIQKMVVFRSDWELTLDPKAMEKIKEYKAKADDWNSDFGKAMAKLSELKAEGHYSEIRDNCRSTNELEQKYYMKKK